MDEHQEQLNDEEDVESIPEPEDTNSNPPESAKDHKPNFIIAIGILFAAIVLAAAYIYVNTNQSVQEAVTEVPEEVEEFQNNVADTVQRENNQPGDSEQIELASTSSSTVAVPAPISPPTTAERIEALIPEDSRIVYRYDTFSYVDDSGEYEIYKALNLDEKSFVYINEDYVKDDERLYYRGDEVYGLDPTDCSIENLPGCRHDVWRDTIEPYNIEVQWYDDLVDSSSIFPFEGNACLSEGYQAGLIANGPLANNPIYIQSEQVCGMWCGGYIELNGIHHVAYEDQFITVRNEGFTIAGVDDFPEKIVIPDSDLHLLTLGPAGFSTPRDTEGRFLFADSQAGDIYDSGHGNYHSVRDDHIRMEYKLEFPFYDEEEGGLDITFDDGTKNQESYSLNGGYGQSFRIEEIPGLENRVVRTGQFNDNHPVYYLINSNDTLLQNLYNSRNTLASYQDGTNKYTYDEFISHRPLLYWKNPFGDWVKMLNSRYETAAEKCKPVIYLYPEETGEFEVYVEPNGGFTETIPEYGNGWEVISTPDSEITDKSTGEVYPYLYWEGVNTGIPDITEGWIVDVSRMEEFLQTKLSILGMNEKEIADFNEYWLDRFETEGASQYKIMFVPQDYFDELSPLTVVGDEKPASIIRVMMYAQPAESGETLPEQILPATPVRQGFTVVEWGGAVLN